MDLGFHLDDYEPGHKQSKGRPKGSPNKATAELRKTVSAFLTHNFTDVQAVYDSAGEREKLTFLTQLLRFALPTLQSVEMQSDLETLSDEQLDYLLTEMKKEMKRNMVG